MTDVPILTLLLLAGAIALGISLILVAGWGVSFEGLSAKKRAICFLIGAWFLWRPFHDFEFKDGLVQLSYCSRGRRGCDPYWVEPYQFIGALIVGILLAFFLLYKMNKRKSERL